MLWSWLTFGTVLVIGVVVVFRRGDWKRARGLDKLVVFGPTFYAAPIAAFGVEHFVLARPMTAMVPRWIPWHAFWIYFVGACFIAAGFSLVTGIAERLSASLLALTFFLFVVLMDTPFWGLHPHDPYSMTLLLRQLAFSGGALALASKGKVPSLMTVARLFIAVGVLAYAYQQFRRADHVPALPLRMVTPDYVPGHAIWTYLTAAAFVVFGLPLLVNWKSRLAASCLGLTVFIVELFVYVPIAIVEHKDFTGINYLADTLMYCGAVLLLAAALPADGGRQLVD